ncbi:hypothetical protein F4810DRAFT_705699 [Camillea tinctor]|nr:hypothetical protein F4810DRAFT_705699 [Camillea tinctor]
MSLGHNVLKDNDPIPSYIRPEHERRDAHIQSPKILESTEIDSGMDWDQILDVHRGENQETPTSKSASPDIIYHKPDAMAEVYIELKDDLIDDIINQTCDIIMEKVCQHGDDVDALSRIVETVVINLMNELMSVPICPSFMSYPQDAGSSPNSSSGTHHGSSSQLHSRGNSSGNNRQQRRSSGGSNDRDDADDPSAPGGNAAVDNVSRPTQPSLFSCPYRKRNPRRFNTRDHHSCAAKGWVWPFLKRHIMNSHMREGQVRMQAAFSCQRCTQGFNTSTALREHVRLNTCDYVDPPEETLGDPEDGITQSERERLKARNVNKINNWSDLWRLLFPTDQEIPSQEFVPPDNTEHIRRDLYRVRPEMEREVMAVLEEPSNIEHGMMSRADIVSQVMQAVYSCIDRTLDQNRITAPRSQASSSMSPTENHDAGDCPQISRKRARLETVQSYTSQNFNFSNQDVPYLVPENTDSASGNSGKPGPLQMSILDSQAIFQPSTQLNWEHRSSPLFAHQYQHPMSTNDHIAPHISFSPGSASGHGSGGFTPGSDTGFSPLSPICPRLVHCDCMQNDLTSNMHHPM